jgi:glucose/arabinose dehydrogenase
MRRGCSAAPVALRSRVVTAVLLLVPGAAGAQDSTSADWRADWAVAEGFTLRRDAEGFRFPTSIAFVPEPGPAPDDPLYFVAELQGTIKVVTNDRHAHTFAADVLPTPARDTLPQPKAETGLAGLCIDPRRGDVFATFAYHDSAGVLRNGMTRFETKPGRFARTPTRRVVITRLFAGDLAAISHQIGPCQVTPGGIYVSLGDGERPERSRDLQSTLGKVVRIDRHGEPASGNPFGGHASSPVAASVWASGFRNPFGLKAVGSRVFVADNGGALDRFLEIRAGGDYGWSGSDLAMGMNAPLVFHSAGVVQMDYCSAPSAGLPPEWAEQFYIALSGAPRSRGNEDGRGKGVYVVDYGLGERRTLRPPRYLMQYRGTGYQSVVGLACGPDAVYVVPIFPDRAGTTAVLAVKYDPASAYPYRLETGMGPLRMMHAKGCFGCHSLNGKGGKEAPVLDRDSLVARLLGRLSSAAYVRSLDSVDALAAEPFASNRGARREVLAAEGMERVRVWMWHHIREPKFDNPSSRMPALGVSHAEAGRITDFLLTPLPTASTPKVRYRHVAFAFAAGLALGVGGGILAVNRRLRSARERPRR